MNMNAWNGIDTFISLPGDTIKIEYQIHQKHAHTPPCPITRSALSLSLFLSLRSTDFVDGRASTLRHLYISISRKKTLWSLYSKQKNTWQNILQNNNCVVVYFVSYSYVQMCTYYIHGIGEIESSTTTTATTKATESINQIHHYLCSKIRFIFKIPHGDGGIMKFLKM